MRDPEAVVLRREFAARERGRGKRYPARLRERATRWIQVQSAAGTSLRVMASALGIDAETARRWRQDGGADEVPTALIPVEVIADDDAPPTRTVSVISPAGFRVEGLSLADAATLMREIG